MHLTTNEKFINLLQPTITVALQQWMLNLLTYWILFCYSYREVNEFDGSNADRESESRALASEAFCRSSSTMLDMWLVDERSCDCRTARCSGVSRLCGNAMLTSAPFSMRNREAYSSPKSKHICIHLSVSLTQHFQTNKRTTILWALWSRITQGIRC